MQEVISYFFSNFFLGAFVLAACSTVIRFVSPKWGGFIYGAIPVSYIYLFVLSGDIKSREIFAKNTLYSVISWIVFVFLTLRLVMRPILDNIIISLIVAGLFLFFQYKWIDYYV